jgi:hypothetical protein
MDAIKSYTDLEQSKKLAKILPLDSADMSWVSCDDGRQKYYQAENRKIILNYEKNHWVPCWSLAALISILPRHIEFKGDKYYLRFMKEYVEYANDEISITGRCLHTTGNNNLVDACVEMILKLKQNNLL